MSDAMNVQYGLDSQIEYHLMASSSQIIEARQGHGADVLHNTLAALKVANDRLDNHPKTTLPACELMEAVVWLAEFLDHRSDQIEDIELGRRAAFEACDRSMDTIQALVSMPNSLLVRAR